MKLKVALRAKFASRTITLMKLKNKNSKTSTKKFLKTVRRRLIRFHLIDLFSTKNVHLYFKVDEHLCTKPYSSRVSMNSFPLVNFP